MIRLKIAHLTRYTYSHPVVLNPHLIFLQPTAGLSLKIEAYELDIAPEPEDCQIRFSIENNPFHLTWFKGETTQLEIRTDMVLLIEPFNPFSFILNLDFVKAFSDPSAKKDRYGPDDLKLLQPYLTYDIKQELCAFIENIKKKSGNPISFLVEVVASIHQHYDHTIRYEENLWTPEHTFERKQGSCRDLSWMLAQMLRSIGLATRFVSGYAFNPELAEGHDLHAWVDVYLPGPGWVGIDPSLGLLVDHHYIPLASSAIPSHTLPVRGSFGGKATSDLHTEVFIEIL
ncbi:transglutaminase family protein [Pararhodonellum marinum]|uniref:transglutaminase family protein n=1 Tax=Pararhodonellum marinum TaxID=2755358 RepID=UPI001E49EAC5|nr:transglutaminase family protein [Pararhodonellum marinum]